MTWGVVQFPGSCDERDALAAAGLVGEARMLWHDDDDLDLAADKTDLVVGEQGAR